MKSLARLLPLTLPLLLIGLVASPSAVAGEAAVDAATTNVPDPNGLGERLALIVWLRENRYEVRLNSTLDEVRGQYRRAQQGNEPWESVSERDRLRRWRQVLISQYRVDIPDGVTAAQLRRIQDHLEAQVQREVDALLAKEAAAPRREPAERAEPIASAPAAKPGYAYAPAAPPANVTIYNTQPAPAPAYQDPYAYYPGYAYTPSHVGFSSASYYGYGYGYGYPSYSSSYYPRNYGSYSNHCYPRYYSPGRVNVVLGVPVSGIRVRASGFR